MKLAIVVAAAMSAIVAVELAVRWNKQAAARTIDMSAQQVFEDLPLTQVSGRELSHQMLVQNTALFSRHPNPKSVTRAYLGTSRTKVLRPEWMGESDSVVAGGNSYNEISYGLILQAELLKRQFPNLQVIFVEASLLLRRPDSLAVEEDHRKYLPLLRDVIPYRADLPGAEEARMTDWVRALRRLESGAGPLGKIQLSQVRQNLRLTNLFWEQETGASLPVSKDPFLATLQANGERKSAPVSAPSNSGVEITQDNTKVQRLRHIPSTYPWDGLFDVLPLWAKRKGLRLVLFQPPVRADLLRFQVNHGLALHVQDMERVAREHRVPFIDLNRAELGYTGLGPMFSDEDHLETCEGAKLLMAALWLGYEQFSERAELFPRVPVDAASIRATQVKAACG